MNAEPALPAEHTEIEFSLEVGEGLLEASAVVPSGVTTMTALLPVLQELSSNIVNTTVANVVNDGYGISCKAGCGACCRQLVPLSLFEAEALANWVRSLPEDQQQALARSFDAALIALRERGMLERLNPAVAPAAGSQEEHGLALDYFHAGVACPFLQDESCGIHPIRPIICREYLVTSPAENCSAPSAATVRVVPMPVRLSTALVRIGRGIAAEGSGWIPLVFLFSWIRMGAQVGAAVEGPGPDLLYAVVSELATGAGDIAPSSNAAM